MRVVLDTLDHAKPGITLSVYTDLFAADSGPLVEKFDRLALSAAVADRL